MNENAVSCTAFGLSRFLVCVMRGIHGMKVKIRGQHHTHNILLGKFSFYRRDMIQYSVVIQWKVHNDNIE